MSLEKIKVKKLADGARLPFRAAPHDAGADLFCLEAFTLAPGERKLIQTGLALEIPPGYYGRVAPRSGLAVKQGIDTMAGVVDAGYRGHLQVLLINLSSEVVSLEAGARIAQLIIERIAVCDFEWADELSDTERGAGGFGSSGQA
ncbi:MAG TPA: dUTP diphosphatase [Blastocatellia bacterium]|nr:dUTP diphosphatase [Blastocatellia bacterium]